MTSSDWWALAVFLAVCGLTIHHIALEIVPGW